MTDRQEFCLWALAMTLVACLLATPAGCTVPRHAQITKAIEAGADPMEASCALEGESQYANTCLLIAARKGDQK